MKAPRVADASVEALKLYHMHMKLTLAYRTDSSLLAPEYKNGMIAVIVAKKVLNPQMGVPVCTAERTYS